MKNFIKILFISIVTLLALSSFAVEVETSENKTDEGADGESETGIDTGMTVMEAAIVELKARVSALEAELADRKLIGTHKYSGNYHSIFFETSLTGFQDLSAPDIEDGVTVKDYLLNQEISSVSYRTTSYEATSDGTILTIPEHELLNNELFVGGTFDSLYTSEGSFELAIGSDGSISLPDDSETEENEEIVLGNMSADGSTFTVLIAGEESSIIIVGVRK
jgi:hypothetical protein